MTEGVVQFPTKAVRQWAELERKINDALSKRGASDVAKKRVTQRMKEFSEMLCPDFNISAEVPFRLFGRGETQLRTAIQSLSDSVGKQFSARLQAFTDELFTERLTREIEMCGELGVFF